MIVRPRERGVKSYSLLVESRIDKGSSALAYLTVYIGFIDLEVLLNGPKSSALLITLPKTFRPGIMLSDPCIKPSIMMYRFLDILGAKNHLGLNQEDRRSKLCRRS